MTEDRLGPEAKMKTGFPLWAIGAVAISMAQPTFAQSTSTNKVADKTDWSVFVEENPKECWAVSKPKETVNTRDGRVVAVRRGDILLFVSYRPSVGINGQVSFTGGYPFAKGSTVTMSVDNSSYELFTDGEWAWASKTDDPKIIAAMKRGAKAVLSARSSRGTKTEDTFSLSGVTAAIDDSEKRCK